MTKEDLINDINFREKCDEYRLNCENAEIYGNVILIKTPVEGLYVIFDKNYNTIGIEKKFCQDIEQFANNFYEKYSKSTENPSFNKIFDYPFENYTIKDFIDLSNKIDIRTTLQGNSVNTRVNEKWYERSSEENKEYFELLSYIKFISEEIKSYFLMSYHMKTMGIEVPEINSYVRLLIKKINASVDYDIENNQRPWPNNILSSIGKNSKEIDFDALLYDIADLLMEQKGVKVKSGSVDKLEQINPQISKKDLSVLSDEILDTLARDENLDKKDDNNIDSGKVLKKTIHS